MALSTLDGPVVLVGDSVTDRPAAPKQILIFFNKTTEALSLFDGTTWRDSSQFVRKTADETLNNVAVLQNDDVLVLPVVASATYLLSSAIIYDAATAADMQFAWVGPTSATLDWTSYTPAAAVSTEPSTLNIAQAAIGDAAAITAGAVGANTKLIANLRGILTTSTTAGTLQLRWAQAVADVSVATVRAQSWMRLERVG